MHYTRRGFSLLLAILMGLGMTLSLVVGSASAHAKVINATPGIGSTIANAPSKVTVETVENMNPDPKLSNLFVYGPSGELISQGDAKVDLNNPKEMSVAITPEKEGLYIVRWITASAEDNDPDQGAFSFTVKTGAGSSTPTTALTPAPQQTTPPTNNGSPLLPAAITGLITLLVGLAAGFGLGRNRAARAPEEPATAEKAGTRER
ncbi:MAG: copper resistance protein CopC [Ktedonobacteraceae bacterium]|nr:copper resistance protein CopC [Ktedonobacteraceae bacterium]